MNKRRFWTSAIALAVTLAGSAYLAAPTSASASFGECTAAQQRQIYKMILGLCDGGTGWMTHTCHADGSITVHDYGCD